ncbi:FtsK/SpoIIIE domain-containing protein [Bifidobacterium aerophilum]|nr:FtsK/SpoIIIE domain-containing protein [Bifidobacterium aerophilum]
MRRWDRVLPLVAAVAPAAAQMVMLAAMLAEGRWLFALMVVPGLVGCAASAALSLRGGRRAGGDGGGPEPDERPASFGERAGGDGDIGHRGIRCPPWEDLAWPGAHDPLAWRRIVRDWLSGPSLDVAIGMAAGGVFRLDLARRGPHALVAGTTGSGKSVLLQTWCLALACRNPPDRLNFVFLDFKGGSAFNRLAALPHVVGNVCDLDLAHAMRALVALEAELTRRERLVAERHAGDIGQLDDPPARLVVVVDEFHALRSQLPDYVDRLVRVAALGRSLGMHLVACTQNPAGQVTADMKANIAVNICLRVRDGMQSAELVGSPVAASISPSLPGAAYCSDGERVEALVCARARDLDAMANAVCSAGRFCATPPARRLFSAPLPRLAVMPRPRRAAPGDGHDVDSGDGPGRDMRSGLAFGVLDDGVRLEEARLRLGEGNVAVVGQPGRGKSTLLSVIAEAARALPGVQVRFSRRGEHGMERVTLRRRGRSSTGRGLASPAGPHVVWLADDADELLDPLGDDPMRGEFADALRDPGVTVVFAVESSRHVRVPEHCATRVVLPTGDRPTDLMDGVPQEVLGRFTHEDFGTPGRAVLIGRGRAMPVQCYLLQSVGETP